MNLLRARRVLVASLLATSVGTHAATVRLETKMQAVNQTDTSCGSPGTNTILRICNRAIGVPLLATDQDGESTEVPFHFEWQADTNTTSVPNFTFDGEARASATLGSLHAFAEVHIGGPGGGAGTDGGIPLPGGLSGFGYVEVDDSIKVSSATLAKGTPVTLSALLAVSGNGDGILSLTVRTFRGSTDTLLFSDVTFADSNESLEDIGGHFTALVGETLLFEYTLRASAGESTSLWNAGNVLNGRSETSNYGNSAFLYFAAVDPTLDLTLEGQSGHDYVLPSAVPLPAAFTLMLPGLAILFKVRTRDGRQGRRRAST